MDYFFVPTFCNEADVPAYTLPALGSREEMLKAVGDCVYGWLPINSPRMEVKLVEAGTALDGLGTRRQFQIRLTNATGSFAFDLLLYLPVSAKTAPVFLGLNFLGNHSAQPDPAILLPKSWVPDGQANSIAHRATEAGRGAKASRWPLKEILEAGCGVATVYYGDFAPDHPDRFREGVFQLVPETITAGEKSPRGGAIAAWAWGLSRALDVLLTLPEIDASRIAVLGHSRLGKTALWAGACDERFSVVISNDSGCGGAALSRRRFGERLIHINTNNPHWCAPAFHAYNEREGELPVDQHQLMAAIAPRALYVASAVEDQWADPRGEYLALAAAAPAWNETLPDAMPPLDQPLFGRRVGYHIRSGKHDITAYDWRQFIAFAKRVWAKDDG